MLARLRATRHIREVWGSGLRGQAAASLEYWGRQLTTVSADDTLRQLMNELGGRQPGAYLRFGSPDIDAAMGVSPTGTPWPEPLISEVRKTFLLSGTSILKALQIACPALGFHQAIDSLSDGEALRRLNLVGACFLDWPVYSYNAFVPAAVAEPHLIEEFYAAVRACRPILACEEGRASEAVLKRLTPRTCIEAQAGDTATNLNALESELLQRTQVMQDEYPVVVLALGLIGRVVAMRLLKRGFRGFLLDLDNLRDAPSTGVHARYSTRDPAHPAGSKLLPASSSSADKLQLLWEGPFLGHYSYAIINRALGSRLGKDPRIELSIRPADTPFTTDSLDPARSPGFRGIVKQVNRRLSQPTQIRVDNHSHHPFRAPGEGHWVTIQPWDYGSLPVRWLPWIHRQVDEVWVPSRFVRSAYLDAGISPDRVAVVPNGVDISLYCPGARKVRLDTHKSFKFLFVGGPFWRKGFDLLLQAYGMAFGARDDVCLVIKSAPEFWTRDGSQALADFCSRSGTPAVLSVVQSLDQQRMAGLYASCDCLIHPYRAEGFALCVAEAMASGLPVVVTGIGGTADFCNPDTAYLIPAELRHMRLKQLDGEPTLDYPSYAEPDLEALVDRMRHVYEHRREAALLAKRGIQKIQNEFTWDHAAALATRRLLALRATPIQRLTAP